MNCYLCSSTSFEQIKMGVRDNAELLVIKCVKCGLVTLNSFNHIDEKFYENSNMHSSKIEISNWLKETEKDDNRRFLYLQDKIKNKSILDFGSGNGGFLFKAREISKKAVGIEPEKQFKSFFKKHNLKVIGSLKELEGQTFDIITAFHVFEHLKDPLETLKALKFHIVDEGEIIIEVPNSDDALLTFYNSNAFSNSTYWSQHLFLFNEKTLTDLIQKSGFKINYIDQIQRYPLSNHLYWLSKGLPNGQNKYSIFNDEILNKQYIKILKREKICDTLLISIKKQRTA
jgi:2-polyprenyl-3-methyl-5-hydroxy-6-metoxy-1,4-benzoquinol methylase